jgi:cytochrome P450
VAKLGRDPLGFLKSLGPLGDAACVRIGTLPVVFLNTPDLVHEVLVTQARSFHKGRFFDRLRDLVGNGLPNSDGPTHLRNRRLMQPAFHHTRIAGYGAVMSEHASALADSWHEGQVLDVDRLMGRLVTSTLAETMFSRGLGSRAIDTVQRNVPVIIENLLLRTVAPKALDRLPIPANRRFDAATRELLEVIDDVVAAARAAGPGGGADLLSVLLEARDAETGESLTDSEIRDELGSILFAGVETSATALTWALHEIASDREVERRLLDELDSVLRGRAPAWEDVPRLPYLRQVLNETLRLHGVTLLMRRTVEPVTVGGIDLPAGAEVAFSLYALQVDPRTFADPGRFDPDRWLPERAAELPRHAFIPFGAGTRKCIGEGWAWTEMTIALATLLSRWRFRPAPGPRPREVAAAVPHPDRLRMTVNRREPRPADDDGTGPARQAAQPHPAA